MLNLLWLRTEPQFAHTYTHHVTWAACTSEAAAISCRNVLEITISFTIVFFSNEPLFITPLCNPYLEASRRK